MFLPLIFRILFSYFFLLILTRLSRKRTLYEASPIDFVIVLIIGDMIDNAIWHDVSLKIFCMASGTIVLIHLINKFLIYRSDTLSHWIQGQPSILWQNQSWNIKKLNRHRISPRDVEAQLREQEIDSVQKTERILLEISSNLSVQPKETEKEIIKKDFLTDLNSRA